MIMVVMLVMGGLSYVNLLIVTAQKSKRSHSKIKSPHHIHFAVCIHARL